ncbi:hypothetical protein J3E69DRAFT_351504 [Trichoderma sp. SZMC 28015]
MRFMFLSTLSTRYCTVSDHSNTKWRQSDFHSNHRRFARKKGSEVLPRCTAAQHRGNAAALGRARRTWPMPCHHPWASLFCLSLSFSFSPFLMSTFISLVVWIIYLVVVVILQLK